MAEDTQEDLSMEDILSSIKDILLEDNAEQQKTANTVEAVPAASAAPQKPSPVVEPDVLDDVLTLSPSMIVEPNLSAEIKTEQPAVSAEEGADPLDLSFDREFDNLPAEPVLEDIEIGNTATSAEVEEEPFDLSNFAINDKNEINLETDTTDADSLLADLNFADTAIDVEADPIFSPEDEASHQENFSANTEDDLPSLDSLIDDDTLNAILGAQPEEPEVLAEPEEEFVEPTDNVFENVVAETIAEPEVSEPEFTDVEVAEVISEPEAEPIYEPEPTTFKMPEPEIAEEADTSTEDETDVAEDEAVDISANMISNFAKMFAEQQKPKAEDNEQVKQELTMQTMSEIELGEGSLTIEEIVRDVVTGIVEKNLSADFDFAAVASTEIARQTKTWLSANLPTIVEMAVKKEIERVMAKVGS